MNFSMYFQDIIAVYTKALIRLSDPSFCHINCAVDNFLNVCNINHDLPKHGLDVKFIGAFQS